MKHEKAKDQERAEYKALPDVGRGVCRAYISALGRMGTTAEAAIALAISARTVCTGEKATRNSRQGGNKAVGNNGRRLLGAQLDALETWARNNKRWAEDAMAWADANFQYEGCGSRSEVFRDKANNRVIKLTDIEYGDVMAALDSFVLFNLAADDANRYSLVGFGRREERFCAILAQPFINGARIDYAATEKLTVNDIESHFNTLLGCHDIVVKSPGKHDYIFENEDITIVDAIPGNVIVLNGKDEGDMGSCLHSCAVHAKGKQLVVLDADFELSHSASVQLDSMLKRH